MIRKAPGVFVVKITTFSLPIIHVTGGHFNDYIFSTRAQELKKIQTTKTL